MHLRMTGTLLYDPPPGTPLHARALRPRRRPRAALLRPAALRHRRAGARRRRAATRSSPPGSASSRSTARSTGAALRALARGRRAPIKAFLLDQRRDRRRRQHLRRRGAVPRADPPAAPGRPLTRAQYDALARRRARRADRRPRRGRRDDRRLPPPRRRRRRLPGRVPRPPPRGRAVPALRHDDPQVRRRRARDLRLRALPAAAASATQACLRSSAGGRSVGRRQLAEAADAARRRRGSAGRSSSRCVCGQLRAAVRVLREIDLVELEPARVPAAPWRARRTSRGRSCRR